MSAFVVDATGMGSELILRGIGPSWGVKKKASENIWPVMDGWSQFLECVNKTGCFQLCSRKLSYSSHCCHLGLICAVKLRGVYCISPTKCVLCAIWNPRPRSTGTGTAKKARQQCFNAFLIVFMLQGQFYFPPCVPLRYARIPSLSTLKELLAIAAKPAKEEVA